MTTRVQVAVVGAGFAGIGTGLALRRAGVESFLILERAARIGGTWRDNTYPGLTCDVPSHLYGFAEHPNARWGSFFAAGPEIQDYLERVAHENGLQPYLSTGSPLTGARWTGTHWVVESDGRVIEADHLVLACGRLTEPRIPQIDGLSTFAGPMFHSARWDHGVPVAGAHIAVVGTGASAVQIVPGLVGGGAHVTLFQRTPAWIVPRGNRAFSEAEKLNWERHPDELARLRQDLLVDGEARFASRSGDARAAAAAREEAVAHLAAQVPDPALRAALTPGYAFGCKRVLLSDDFYPAVASPAVDLEPSALVAVSGRTLVAASGARYDVDALVLATGFQTAEQPYARLVRGEDGQSLAEHWSTGMTSVASTLVHGFPNLYVLNGPNAALGHNSAVLLIEEQITLAMRLIVGAQGPVRVSAAQEAEYTGEIERRSAGTPWMTGGCDNWYVDRRSGRLTLLWPGTVADFRSRLAEIGSSVLAGAG